MPTDRPLLAVVGPTASGKTRLVELLAERMPIEAVAADAMQVYAGMDIGTAKPDRDGPVRYHCIDLVEPSEVFSVVRYQRAASDALGDIRSRGLLPVLVGGTGLYVRAVVDEMGFAAGEPSSEVRGRLLREAENFGVRSLYDRLVTRDPKAAAKIHPGNLRRIIRALEWLESGDVPSERHARFQERPERPGIAMFGLEVDRRELARRIETRVREMLDSGLAAEVRALYQGGRLGPTAVQAIGYKEIVEYLRGRMSWEKAVETTIVRTRQYAKRQLTWFGRDKRVSWVDGRDLPGAADHIAAECARRGLREMAAANRADPDDRPRQAPEETTS